MAGDWIKMRTDLYRDPKVCVMADLLLDKDSDLARYVSQNMQRDMSITRNVMRNVTVGALVSVWGVLRHRGKRVDDDLVIKGCGLSVVDDLSDLPGFGAALLFVGWVKETTEAIVFPRFFEEFNVDPSEELKAKNAERQRRFREKKKAESNVTVDVTVASQSNAREEKRREYIYKAKKARASSIPKDFTPNETGLEKATAAGLSVERELEKFRNHHAAKGSTMLDWQAAWRTWVGNAVEFGRGRTSVDDPYGLRAAL